MDILEWKKLKLIKKCIHSWHVRNPNWTIIILNKNNIHSYLPDFDESLWPNSGKIQYYSDIIRCKILLKYGGIWSDASILCFNSYDWILDLQKKEKYEFIGYYINNDYSKSPVIENWFFAVVPNSYMMNKWFSEISRIKKYKDVNGFITQLNKEADLSKVNKPYYLWMNAAMQKILQKKKNSFHYKVFSAHEGPFKYLSETQWNHKKHLMNYVTILLKTIVKKNMDV